MKVKISITLDESILTKIDEIRGLVPRSIWINNELTTCVGDQK